VEQRAGKAKKAVDEAQKKLTRLRPSWRRRSRGRRTCMEKSRKAEQEQSGLLDKWKSQEGTKADSMEIDNDDEPKGAGSGASKDDQQASQGGGRAAAGCT
jgi:hypothetical protein